MPKASQNNNDKAKSSQNKNDMLILQLIQLTRFTHMP